MITCEACGAEFAKPATRGRPPKRCVECRVSGKTNKPTSKGRKTKSKTRNPDFYDWGAKSIISESSDDPEAAEEAAQIKKRRAAYRTGFCGVTRVLGRVFTHAEEIHNLCPGSFCACKCHEGIPVWDQNPKMVV